MPNEVSFELHTACVPEWSGVLDSRPEVLLCDVQAGMWECLWRENTLGAIDGGSGRQSQHCDASGWP